MEVLKKLKKNKSYYLFCFFVVSIFSWILEVLFSLVFRGKLVNPGSLAGPWCQIYGVACLLCLALGSKKDMIMTSFIKLFLCVSITEYTASFISDKFFNRIIWNYSKYILNIRGRICLHMTLLFTIMGLIWLYLIEPMIRKFYNSNKKICNVLSLICLVFFIIDLIFSWII